MLPGGKESRGGDKDIDRITRNLKMATLIKVKCENIKLVEQQTGVFHHQPHQTFRVFHKLTLFV